jgi:hypothetical protein
MVVARFGSSTKPDAPEVVAIVERELANDAAWEAPAASKAAG